MVSQMKTVSIVVPLYNEENIVDELVSRVRSVTNKLNYNFEFVVVDDGSTDRTLEMLLEHKKSEARLKIVKLSRNWGFQNAYNAGLDHAEGDAVIFMDGDLQDPPELIPEFLKKWEEGYDVVYSVKTRRNESKIRLLMISLFYRLIKRFANVSIDKQAGMFSLLNKKAADQLRYLKEKSKFYVGLRSFVGFRQTKISYERDKRFAGRPRQSIFKLINYALNAFFSFSFLPIRILTYFGLVILFLSFILFILLAFLYFFKINFLLLEGSYGLIATLLILLFIISVQIIFLGILGEYIVRIFEEVRNRPYYIVEKVY